VDLVQPDWSGGALLRVLGSHLLQPQNHQEVEVDSSLFQFVIILWQVVFVT